MEKSHVKARESLRGKKKVRLVKIAEGKSEDGFILSLPREEEERGESKVDCHEWEAAKAAGDPTSGDLKVGYET